MMRIRAVKTLIIFATVNVFGILTFYGWVISNQFWRKEQRAASPLFLSTISDLRLNYSRSATSAHQQDGHLKPTLNIEIKGHTLKPFKRKPDSLAQIPPVPEFSTSDNVPLLDDTILQKFREYPQKSYTDPILILTPIHNVAGRLKTFLHLLQSLTYPHQLISIAFGEDSSEDNTLHVADGIAEELRKSFARANVFHFNLTGQISGSWSTIHSKDNQFQRRRHLAQARNSLLRFGLKKEEWVLWIDSDVNYFAPDIIQQLLSAGKEIVTPLCIYINNGKKRVYDKNTWRETSASLSLQKHLSPDALVVEGYDSTKRLWLSDLRAEGRVVPIDGVGGCMLLIHSKCHKEGLIFPEKVFQHHIETEGLGKMAKQMGYEVYGMPFVEIVH